LPKSTKTFAPTFKVWLTRCGLYVVGEGGAELLKAIKNCGSIAKAAKRTGVSYKYAWDQLGEMERALREPLLRKTRGGRRGGGAELTETANILLRNYQRVKTHVRKILNDPESWEAIGLKISARNRLKGIIEDVKKGGVTSSVKIKVQVPVTVTALISKEAVEDLDLRVGDEVEAVIKATEVMVAKD
jgi:molybdate transport system regulatory protein